LIRISEVAAVSFYAGFYHYSSVGSAAKMSVLLMTLLQMDADCKEHSTKQKDGSQNRITEVLVGPGEEIGTNMNKENRNMNNKQVQKRVRVEIEDTTKVR